MCLQVFGTTRFWACNPNPLGPFDLSTSFSFSRPRTYYTSKAILASCLPLRHWKSFVNKSKHPCDDDDDLCCSPFLLEACLISSWFACNENSNGKATPDEKGPKTTHLWRHSHAVYMWEFVICLDVELRKARSHKSKGQKRPKSGTTSW